VTASWASPPQIERQSSDNAVSLFRRGINGKQLFSKDLCRREITDEPAVVTRADTFRMLLAFFIVGLLCHPWAPRALAKASNVFWAPLSRFSELSSATDAPKIDYAMVPKSTATRGTIAAVERSLLAPFFGHHFGVFPNSRSSELYSNLRLSCLT
jgi:hypothetical protein